MDWLVIIYLFYVFVALYFMSFYTLLYLPNRKNFFSYPKYKKEYSLSIVIPCYNEEKNIGGTIESLLKSNYKGLKKIIAVDDCSTDNSFKIIKKYAKKYKRVMALQTPKNTGRASGAKNYGAKFADTELIGFTDADSYPEKDAIRKMIGFFDNEEMGAVTSLVLVKNVKKIIEKLQAIEYKVIAFTRKLLGFIGAIYVTPGPLAIYRKKAFDDVNGFDESNLTEDIEITWHLVYKNYKIAMSIPSRVYTVAPETFKGWFKQRIRWNLGGLQTINKYKVAFLKKGILGGFILPFFVFSWVLGLVGLAILVYRLFRTIVVRYLAASYSVQSQTAILTLRDINLVPSVLIFFGVVLLLLGFLLVWASLHHTKGREFKKYSLFDILVYTFVYLLSYPIILIVSVYMLIRKKESW